VEDVLKQMTTHNIIAMPIERDENDYAEGSTNEGGSNKYVCIISVLDVMAYVAFKSANDAGVKTEPIENLCGISEEGQTLWQYNAEDNLSDVMNAFSKGVHRCLVCFPSENYKCYVFTQTDVVRYFYNNRVAAEAIMKTPITETGPGIQRVVRGRVTKRKLVCVKDTATALSAYQKIYEQEVNAVAIVSADDGSLIATLSASDIRGMTNTDLSDLDIPILDYIRKAQGGQINKQVTVPNSADVSIGDVINLIMEHKLHRVWVLENNKPVEVITLTDIIGWFSK